MPIHLPPLSRRRFLASSIAAGAGLMFRPAWGAEKPVDNDFWALFSDIHIAADRSKIARGINMTDHLKAVSQEVINLPRRPAGVLISGDCAFNSGEVADYENVRALLKILREAGMPVHLTLGNHDVRERFLEVLAPEAKAAPNPVAGHYVSVVKTPRVNWFILDSLEKVLSTPGFLGAAQLQWLAGALDAHPDKPALVVAHHNLTVVGSPKMALKDTAQLLEIIRPRKQVKAYIFGHTHDWTVKRDDSGIHFVNLPPVAYVFKEGRPSGWVHATLKDGGARIELRCLDEKHENHGQIVDLEWRAA